MFEILQALLRVREAALANKGGYDMRLDREGHMLTVTIPVSDEDIEFYDQMSQLFAPADQPIRRQRASELAALKREYEDSKSEDTERARRIAVETVRKLEHLMALAKAEGLDDLEEEAQAFAALIAGEIFGVDPSKVLK